MKYIPSILFAMVLGSAPFISASDIPVQQMAVKGFHDCEHAAYGQAEMFVSSEGELEGNHNSFTLLPNNTPVDDLYVPFQVAGIEERMAFDSQSNVFKIKHTGYYKIGYYFKCSGAIEEFIADTLNIGIRITDKNGNEKQVYGFHKIGLSGINNLLRQVFEVSDQCIAKLHKGDTVGLYIFQLPQTLNPIVYINTGSPAIIPDTAASLSIFKAETD